MGLSRPIPEGGWRRKLHKLVLATAIGLYAACTTKVGAQTKAESNGLPSLSYRKSYALVIGNDAYAKWPRLKNAVSDADKVQKALSARGFEVTFKTDLAGEDLDKAFKEWFLFAGQDDQARLLVWFAGHGHMVPRVGGVGFNTYIVPVDAVNPEMVPVAEKRQAEVAFRTKALSLARFEELLKEANARHVLLIFDSCFAGDIFASARGGVPSPTITRYTMNLARQFITSGTAKQTVSDDGMFQRLFIGAITGEMPKADQNKDGFITATELGLYLQQEVTNLTRNKQTPDFGRMRLENFEKGDFVFAVGKPSDGPLTDLAELQAAAQEQIWFFVRDLSLPVATERYLEKYPQSRYRSVAEAQLKTLRTPSAVVRSSIEETRKQSLPSVVPVERPLRAVSVLFGTDRNRDGNGFGTARPGILATGEALVSIPEEHRAGRVEMPAQSLFGITLGQSPNPRAHFATLSLKIVGTGDFSALPIPVPRESGAGGTSDALLYVHGFNTTFQDALYRSAQLSWDAQFTGQTFMYSWPSEGKAASYLYDRESISVALPSFRQFVDLAASKTASKKIDVIGHSLGARLVMEAAARPSDGRGLKFGQIVLFSPDMDPDEFDILCVQARKNVERITIYARRDDKTLGAASLLTGRPRAGAVSASGPAVRDGCADVIDVTPAAPEPFALGTELSADVLQDVARLLRREGTTPATRTAKIQPATSERGPYWRLVQ
jgi:esterase/lipase superfamily enzyme/uncharacterized caspase-like protein